MYRSLKLGLTGLALSGLTLTIAACGQNPLAPAPEPAVSTPATPPAETPSSPGTPTVTSSASPATPTATPTAVTPSATPATPTPAAPASSTARPNAELPTRVESFERVAARSENGVLIGTYRSGPLNTVLEVRQVTGRPPQDLLTQFGVTETSTIGPAICGEQIDTYCAQERDGRTILVISSQLPAATLAELTSQFLDN